MRAVLALLAAILGGVSLGGCGDDASEPRRLRLATTTSARDTGLLDAILPRFEGRAGVEVQVIAVGTGQAIEIAKRGDADILLVHDRAREDEFVASGFGIDRRDLMWNEFVIVGPPEDPAGTRGPGGAAEALRRISGAAARFVSRGDRSGAHGRELSLWTAAGGRSEWDDYWEAGQGQAETLRIADEKGAYCLSDRGTWLKQRRTMRLAILVEGDPALMNPYGVILVNPEKHPHANAADARRLLDWLTSAQGQRAIGEFRIDGEAPFQSGAPP
jgi:tungstate transport system substrate-binding protein